MIVLLTGSSGFLGQNVLRSILKEDQCQLVCLDIYGGFDQVKHDSVQFIKGSFLNQDDLPSEVEVIVHCARTIKPSPLQQTFLIDIEQNVLGTVRFFDTMKRRGLKKFIIISSGGTVYGQNDGSCKESDRCIPINYYGLSCLTTERYLQLAGEASGIKVIVLRVANPFGPYQQIGRKQGFVNIAIQKIVLNESIEVWGDGNAIRDYVYAQDVGESVLKAINYDGESNIFNVGTGIGRSINEVLEDLKLLVDDLPEVCYLNTKFKAVTERNVLDIQKAGRILDWTPKVNWNEALEKTYTHYSDLLSE
jgi:UDP-glucose 4-epimerase